MLSAKDSMTIKEIFLDEFSKLSEEITGYVRMLKALDNALPKIVDTLTKSMVGMKTTKPNSEGLWFAIKNNKAICCYIDKSPVTGSLYCYRFGNEIEDHIDYLGDDMNDREWVKVMLPEGIELDENS